MLEIRSQKKKIFFLLRLIWEETYIAISADALSPILNKPISSKSIPILSSHRLTGIMKDFVCIVLVMWDDDIGWD